MGRILFFISEAFRALRRQAAPSIAAIVTVGVTTLLLGVLIPVLRASRVQEHRGPRADRAARLPLSATRPRPDADKIQEQIEAIDHVDGAEYISKKEAVKILEGRVEGDLKDSLDELRANPLPASFDVGLDDPDNLEAVQNDLQPAGPERQAEADQRRRSRRSTTPARRPTRSVRSPATCRSTSS